MESGFTKGIMDIEKVVKLLLGFVFITMIISIVMILIYVIYRLLRSYGLKKLEYKRYFSEKGAFEEQEIYLIEEFTNHSILPMFKVDVETHVTAKLHMPGCSSRNEINQEFISRFFVMPFTRIKRRHKVVCMQRGCYKLESAKVSFMKVEIFLDSRAYLKVYPRELEINDINRLNQCLQASEVSGKSILKDPFSFARVREYAYGDSMNTINHKATARAGKLMVNESEFVLGRRIVIYLNFQDWCTGITAEQFKDILEKAMQYASYIAGTALKEGWQIGIRANCRLESGENYLMIQPGNGYGKYIEILDGLAEARTIFGNSIGYVMNIDIDDYITNTEIIFFTTYIDCSIQEKIEKLEHMGNAVYPVNLKEVTAYEK